MPATPCGNEGIDPCGNPIHCRRPAGHRADDGGHGWHSHGSIFWNDDTALTWGDETSDGPFTPAMPYDELPEAEPMEPGPLGEVLRAAQATLAKLRRSAPTGERGAFEAISQALQACLRAADMEGIQRAGERLERIKATEGHERALAEVTAERDELNRRLDAKAEQHLADLREAIQNVAGAGKQGAQSGYAQALKNVHEYKWPHRGGPTEDEFSDFYAAIEAAGR